MRAAANCHSTPFGSTPRIRRVTSACETPFCAITLMLSNLPDQKPPDLCIWGDPVTQDVIWRDHDPTELARNLGGLFLYQATGNGIPGPYDDPAKPNPSSSLNEFGINLMNQAFDQAKPWDLVKDPGRRDELHRACSDALHAFFALTVYLAPMQSEMGW